MDSKERNEKVNFNRKKGGKKEDKFKISDATVEILRMILKNESIFGAMCEGKISSL